MNKKTDLSTPDALLHDLRVLLTEAESAMSGPAAGVADAFGGLRARYDAAQARFADLYDSAKKNVSEGAQRTDEAIRANPYQSLAVALGLGVLIGVLVGRRTK